MRAGLEVTWAATPHRTAILFAAFLVLLTGPSHALDVVADQPRRMTANLTNTTTAVNDTENATSVYLPVEGTDVSSWNSTTGISSSLPSSNSTAPIGTTDVPSTTASGPTLAPPPVTEPPLLPTCGAATNNNNPRRPLFSSTPTCSIAVGCQRTFCSCLGLVIAPSFVTSQSSLSNATSATSTGDALCVEPLVGETLSNMTCRAISKCHTDAIVCFEQAASITALVPECSNFSRPLFDAMVLAANDEDSTDLTDACTSFQCTSYNTTTAYGLDAPLFSRCRFNATSKNSCPVPKPGVVVVIIRGRDWELVLLPSRRTIFQAALEQDLAIAVGNSAQVMVFELFNRTELRVNISVQVDAAVTVIEAKLGNGTSWLETTSTTYSTYGGRGDLEVHVIRSNGLDPDTTLAPNPTLEVPTAPPYSDGGSDDRVGNASESCSVGCAVGLAIAGTAAAAFVVGGAFMAATRMRVKSTVSQKKILADEKAALRQKEHDQPAVPPSDPSKYCVNDHHHGLDAV